MAEEQTRCYQCNKIFNNGEFVAVNNSDVYHYINEFGVSVIPLDCSMKPPISGKIMCFNLGIFYEGKVYSYEELNKLENVKELRVQPVDDKEKCSKIIGNLEGLANAKPFFQKK